MTHEFDIAGHEGLRASGRRRGFERQLP
jgi:hypothetical protein